MFYDHFKTGNLENFHSTSLRRDFPEKPVKFILEKLNYELFEFEYFGAGGCMHPFRISPLEMFVNVEPSKWNLNGNPK